MKPQVLLGGVTALTALSTLLLWLHMIASVRKVHHDEPPVETRTQTSAVDFQSTDVLPFCPSALDLNVSSVYTSLKHRSNFSPGQRTYSERILILTPLSNSAERLGRYFRLLCSLSYPHRFISIGLGEDSSTDKTFEIASAMSRKLSPYFRRIQVFHFDDTMGKIPLFSRHDHDLQLERRTHLAHARNQLLMHALRDEDWVLWIDSDVGFVPPDLIQHLLSADADVIAPSCMYIDGNGKTKVYDRNTWRESNHSLEFLKAQKADYLMLEGYMLTRRTYLPYLAHEGLVVPIDGVGGCTLMVRAQSHRKGLNFPPYVLDHHIETEGLAKMAAKMKLRVRGLPMVSVVHS